MDKIYKYSLRIFYASFGYYMFYSTDGQLFWAGMFLYVMGMFLDCNDLAAAYYKQKKSTVDFLLSILGIAVFLACTVYSLIGWTQTLKNEISTYKDLFLFISTYGIFLYIWIFLKHIINIVYVHSYTVNKRGYSNQ